MAFLQHSNTKTAPEPDSTGKSKWREKDRRKRLRAQEEIAEFFVPKRQPMQEMGNNTDHGYSKYRDDNARQESVDRGEGFHLRRSSPHYQRTPSLDLRQRSYLYSKRLERSPHRSLPPHEDSPAKQYLRAVLNSPHPFSGQATSYISWSETQFTPEQRATKQQGFEQQIESPIPEHVQRSIERTGILRDTGISILQKPRNLAPASCSRTTRSLRPADRGRRLSHISSELSCSELAATSSSSNLPGPTELSRESVHGHNVRSSSDSKQNVQRAASRSPAAKENENVDSHFGHVHNEGREFTAIQNFDHGFGWHQKSASDALPHPSAAVINKVETRDRTSTSIDRAELVGNAFFARPLSTLPAGQSNASPRVEGEANQDDLIAEQNRTNAVENPQARSRQQVGSKSQSRQNDRNESPAVQKNELAAPRKTMARSHPGIAKSNQQHESASRTSNREGIPSALLSWNPAHLERELQTPSSLEFRPVDGAHSDKKVSWIGLPFRGSSNGRDPSHSMVPSRLTPITGSEPPLFIRQMQQELKREDDLQYQGHGSDEHHGKQYIPQQGAQSQFEEDYTNMNQYHQNYVQEYDLDYALRIQDAEHCEYEHQSQYATEDMQQRNAQPFHDNPGAWQPRLNRIDEQVEYYEYDGEAPYEEMQDVYKQYDESAGDQFHGVAEVYDMDYENYAHEQYFDTGPVDLHDNYSEYQYGDGIEIESTVNSGGFWKPRTQF